ncbi:MAG: class GN sortase [Parvularculaceae bacterium]
MRSALRIFGRSPLRIAAGAAFLTGAAMLAYASYMPAKAALAQILLQRAWTEAQAGRDARPWPWADATAIAEIRAPRLGKRQIVLSAASGEAMAFAPGHMRATPLPGDPGVSIIAAHRDTHFRFLRNLQIGDLLEVSRDGRIIAFRVTELRVVRWDRSGIDAAAPGRRLALVTCYPFDAVARGPLRYVVIGESAAQRPNPASDAVTNL